MAVVVMYPRDTVLIRQMYSLLLPHTDLSLGRRFFSSGLTRREFMFTAWTREVESIFKEDFEGEAPAWITYYWTGLAPKT